MAFNIVDCENGTLIRFQRKPGLAEFQTSTRAAKYAKRRGEKDGRKYKIRVAPTDDSEWIAREQRRYSDGTYVKVPFYQDTWFMAGTGEYSRSLLQRYSFDHLIPILNAIKNHFPHVSMTNRGMLAYTESSEKGARDIQTQIKPGAYLSKYFGSVLSPSDIQAHVSNWQRKFSECDLKFARTPDEIVHVYQNGPRSCMSGQANEYLTRTKSEYRHPCEVYGKSKDFDGDLTLAYYQGKHGISARVLVWEEKKQFGRIYGDSTLLLRELQAMGYVNSRFNGARIAKIKVGPVKHQSYLMPYIDGWSEVLERPDHFLITNGQDLSRDDRNKACWHRCDNTCGTSGNPVYECEECGEAVESNDACRVDGSIYCSDCYNEHFTYCERLNICVRRESTELVVVYHRGSRHGGEIYYRAQTWCERAIRVHAFRCPVEGVLFANELGVMDDGVRISSRAYEAKHPPVALPAPSPAPQPQPSQSVQFMTTIDWASGIDPTTTRR